ncbi:MAG: calcium/sodium antiporter [Gammaproteobacteria bacterium]|nr:calcium/sodium antiporter [Gammaproteobacteria bacterium]
MLLAIASIVFGLGLLVWAADRFVIGAAALARNLGVPPLLIGLTIVGFGTSAPEILVSTMAALQGNPGLAIGNAIGSNIANIALILGATALIAPLTVHSDILRREYPLLLFVSVGAYLLLFDGTLDGGDGLMLMTALVLSMLLLVRIGMARQGPDPLADEIEAEIPSDVSTPAATGWFLLGLALLVVSSRMLVWGSVEVATALGVSDLVIGLTIVAIGTSLPELAASIMSALKNEHDLAIGNVIGSNLWNLLAVLGVPGLLAPGLVPAEAVDRDMLVMLGLTLALFVMGRGSRTRGVINRLEGGLLLGCFIAYQGLLVWQTQAAMS